MAGSDGLHCKLRLRRRRGRGMADSCCLQCRLWLCRRSGMGTWRVHTGFTVGRGSVGEEAGGMGGGFFLASL